MTTYYNKAFGALDSKVYGVNPAYYITAAKLFGRVDIKPPSPWLDRFVDFKVAQTATNMFVGDELKFADSDSKLVSGKMALKFFGWSMSLKEAEMREIESNPNGFFAQQKQQELQAQQDNMAFNLEKYVFGMLATTNATTDRDYSSDWSGAFKPVADNGTAEAPASCESTAGTETDLTGVEFAGASASVDALYNSFGVVRNQFFQQYDSTTGQAMYHGGIDDGKGGNNTFHVFMHPAALNIVNSTYPLEAAAVLNYSKTYRQQAIEQGFILGGTMACDAAYDGASATAANCVMVMNITENFKINEVIPYTIEPWKEYTDPKYGVMFRKRAYTKIGVFKRPWYLNSKYKKACAAFKFDPYANA